MVNFDISLVAFDGIIKVAMKVVDGVVVRACAPRIKEAALLECKTTSSKLHTL